MFENLRKSTLISKENNKYLKSLYSKKSPLILESSIGSYLFKRSSLFPVDLLNYVNPKIIMKYYHRMLSPSLDIVGSNTLNSIPFFTAKRLNTLKAITTGISLLKQLREESQISFAIAGKFGPVNYSKNREGKISGDLLNSLKNSYFLAISESYNKGADLLLLETFHDFNNFTAAYQAYLYLLKVKKISYKDFPLIASFVVNNKGFFTDGSSLIDNLKSFDLSSFFALGLNCVSDISSVQLLRSAYPELSLSFYPNAGIPDKNGNYIVNQNCAARKLKKMAKNLQLKIVGGCCGFDKEFYSELVK